jgi:small subunit ribosomal protein S17
MVQGNRPTQVGRVASNKMQKTVVVEVEKVKRHPLYHRNIRRTERVKAHDELNSCQVGDLVRIEQTRPLSKEKRWRVSEILERAQGPAPVE